MAVWQGWQLCNSHNKVLVTKLKVLVMLLSIIELILNWFSLQYQNVIKHQTKLYSFPVPTLIRLSCLFGDQLIRLVKL